MSDNIRQRRSKYRLSDLLDNTDYPLPAADREWIDAPATGREIIGNDNQEPPTGGHKRQP